MSEQVPKKNTYLSRSALAEKLGMSLKELTGLMMDSGWLSHNESAAKGQQWQLTAKGEFEGGEYRESKKFGAYIVWPESVLKHPAICEGQRALVNVGKLASPLGLSATIVNRLLADMGWLAPYTTPAGKGWKVTELGLANGGQQKTNEETGTPFVLWPRSLVEHPALTQHISLYRGESSTQTTTQTTTYTGLDGYGFDSKTKVFIANYLYLMGYGYAYQRQHFLSPSVELSSDFYLPEQQVYILYQEQDIPPSELSQQLSRQALAKQYPLKTIELTPMELTSAGQDQLEQQLSKALIKLGISEG